MKKFIFVFSLFLLSFLSYPQKKGKPFIDSLLLELPKTKEDTVKVNLLNALSLSYAVIDTKTGMQYAEQALALSKRTGWRKGEADAYLNISENYSQASNYDAAIQFANRSLVLYNNSKDQKNIIKSYKEIANNYYRKGDTPKAFSNMFKALSIGEKVKDDEQMGIILSDLAVYYHNQQEMDKAKEYELKAIAINKRINNKKQLIKNYFHMVRYCRDHVDNEIAMKYSMESLRLSKEINDSESVSLALVAVGSAYEDKYDYNSAEKYYLDAVKITESGADALAKIRTYCNIGDFYIALAEHEPQRKKEHLSSAKNYFQKAIVINKGVSLQWMQFIYERLSVVAQQSGAFENALEAFQLSIIYKDSVFDSEKKATIKNLEDQRTIEVKNNEIKLNKITLESKEKQKWFYLLGIGSLLIIAGLVFRQSRNRKKTNEKLQLLNAELDEANKVKTRFFSILNHDLRSPVSSLISFLHLQKDSPELLDAESKARMETKTISSAENLLESMEDILLWSKGQMEHFRPQPKQIPVATLFEDLQKHFSNIEHVKLVFEDPEIISLFTDENYLKTILRNLVSNAIKALGKTPNAAVVITAGNLDGNPFLSVSDNGPGGTIDQFKALYDDKEVVGIKTGLGLHLIRDLARAIDCKISVDTKQNEGTVFTLLFQ